MPKITYWQPVVIGKATTKLSYEFPTLLVVLAWGKKTGFLDVENWNQLIRIKIQKMPLKIFFFAFFWIAAGSFFATRENCLHFTLWQIYVIFHHSRKNCFKVSKYRKGHGSKKRGWACTFHQKQKEERRGGVFAKISS